MACSCNGFPATADRQFDVKKAAAELKDYRRGRLEKTTRLLRDAMITAGLNRGTLLDIGAGIGALTFELLKNGMSGAVIAEASSAYAEAAREEAARSGRGNSVEITQGDVVDIGEKLPVADVVTLNRVVCCYPFYEPLLDEAARHAKRGIAVSYPKDRWYVRMVIWFDNLRHARKTSFRTFVHPPREMIEIVERSGFNLVGRSTTLVWTIDVFVRNA